MRAAAVSVSNVSSTARVVVAALDGGDERAAEGGELSDVLDGEVLQLGAMRNC